MDTYISDYVMALSEEIKQVGRFINQSSIVNTIYFGGGTPSILQMDHIKQIFQMLNENVKIRTEPEISFEVNPGTVSRDYLRAIFRLGINRLSIGMQSADEAELKMLGRIHDLKDVKNALDWAKNAGFHNISLDLIFGLPGQTMQSWRKSLNAAIKMQPHHISLYALTIETNTPLSRDINKNNIPLCPDDLAADMYEWAMETLPGDGYIQYEISNWAKEREGGKNYQCAHNLQYWRNGSYIGLGAGAHSHYNNKRWENISSIPEYIKAIKQTLTSEEFFARINVIDNDMNTEMQETMMLGLRLVEEGISKKAFISKYGEDMTEKFSEEINKLLKVRLIEWEKKSEDKLKLTKHGILLGNQVFVNFVN